MYLFDDSNQMIYQNLNAQKAAPLTSDTIFDQNGVNTQFQQQYPFPIIQRLKALTGSLSAFFPLAPLLNRL